MDWTAASVIVSAIGIIVTIVIASRSANKELRHNRFLQERDIAIRLLHENEFDSEWLAAKRALFEKLIFEMEFDWKTFSSRKFSPKDELGPKEKVFGHQVTMVLNHLEFICVAILTGAANEEIIKAQIKKQITLAFNRLQPYIEEARRITDDQNVYCNLETVAKNWIGEKDVAMKLKF